MSSIDTALPGKTEFPESVWEKYQKCFTSLADFQEHIRWYGKTTMWWKNNASLIQDLEALKSVMLSTIQKIDEMAAQKDLYEQTTANTETIEPPTPEKRPDTTPIVSDKDILSSLHEKLIYWKNRIGVKQEEIAELIKNLIPLIDFKVLTAIEIKMHDMCYLASQEALICGRMQEIEERIKKTAE